MLYDLLRRLKEGTEFLNYGRPIIERWGAEEALQLADRGGVLRVLDLGCGHGTDLKNIREAAATLAPEVRIELYGIENYAPYIAECRAAGIEVFAVDIERDRYPVQDGFFDVVLANQVLEHTKEIFWIFAEVIRILRPGGSFIVGVPNLASLHNRILLLFGRQPSAQKSYSAHVRSFTKPDLESFGALGGFLKAERYRGSNFYPFPPAVSRPLARILPRLAWGLFVLFRRQERSGSFLECLSGEDNLLETPFYGSPQNPAPKAVARRAKSNNKGRRRS